MISLHVIHTYSVVVLTYCDPRLIAAAIVLLATGTNKLNCIEFCLSGYLHQKALNNTSFKFIHPQYIFLLSSTSKLLTIRSNLTLHISYIMF